MIMQIKRLLSYKIINPEKVYTLLIFLFSYFLNGSLALSATPGFFDFNYYYDTRDFNVQTINTMVKPTHKVEYFGFVNYFSSRGDNGSFDQSSFFTEQNLRYQIGESIVDGVMQSALQSGVKNDVLRMGLRFRASSLKIFENTLSKKVNYSVAVYFAQFDSVSGYNWQMEHVYRFQLIDDLLFISGFLDHNILQTGHRFVGEHQLSMKLLGGLHAHIEYRSNDFLPFDNTGWGLGMGYLLIF